MRIKCAQKTTKGCLLAPPKVCYSCDSLQPFRKQYPVKHTAVKHFLKIYIFKGCKYIFYFASILIPKYLFIFIFLVLMIIWLIWKLSFENFLYHFLLLEAKKKEGREFSLLIILWVVSIYHTKCLAQNKLFSFYIVWRKSLQTNDN